jgi:EAL domain-containing protein (putative c-di-GMP-specific phosphodiesterase class I)
MVGVEALLRWEHPLEGNFSPSEFIPESESNGTINAIGHWVIETTFSQTKRWQQLIGDNFKVSINISVVQVFHPDFIDNIKKLLLKTGVNPKQVEFEITETMLIKNYQQGKEVIIQLQHLGISVAIDDFGVGFSSFSYLTQFNFNTLKIDKSFIQSLAPNNLNYKVLKNIYNLAKDLELEVVAEGVEHIEQLNILAEFNGAVIQGHYYSEPVNASTITGWLTNQDFNKTLINKQFPNQNQL